MSKKNRNFAVAFGKSEKRIIHKSSICNRINT